MAETSPHGIDRRRRGPAGGWWRGTSQWRTFCSTCSPAVGGRQYRVQGEAQVRLRSGLEAPMRLRPLARHRPPNSSLPELDAIFIIPGAAKRHKRLRPIGFDVFVPSRYVITVPFAMIPSRTAWPAAVLSAGEKLVGCVP